jgi:hypothetical protein
MKTGTPMTIPQNMLAIVLHLRSRSKPVGMLRAEILLIEVSRINLCPTKIHKHVVVHILRIVDKTIPTIGASWEVAGNDDSSVIDTHEKP